jgi:hypothetical protein
MGNIMSVEFLSGLYVENMLQCSMKFYFFVLGAPNAILQLTLSISDTDSDVIIAGYSLMLDEVPYILRP